KENVKTSWNEFAPSVEYMKADLANDVTYKNLMKRIREAEEEWKKKATLVYYMSVAPQLAPIIAEKLHQTKLTSDCKRSRMVFENPFGHDLSSAAALNIRLGEMFKEEQIYRIDHYLGKGTV